MRTAVSTLSLLRPRTLADALVMLRDETPLTPLAGCTDLYVGLQFGTLADRRFVDLWPLDELRGIAATPAGLRIGALTTFSELIASALVRRRLPMLVAAAREVGGRQIQNRGTLGGNVANASPAGDSLPVLAAADAVVVLRSVENERRIPFTSYYTGYRASVRRPDELIAAIEIPRIDGKQYWRKVGTRRAQAISKVSGARLIRENGARQRRADGHPSAADRTGSLGRRYTGGGPANAACRDRADRRYPFDGCVPS
jgi:xanthine dehydrogenase small subunit